MSHILLAHPPEELAQILGLEKTPAARENPHVEKCHSIPVFKACHFGSRTMIEATWGVPVSWRDPDDDHMHYVRSDSVVYGTWLEALPNICTCVIPASAMILYPHWNKESPRRVLCRKDRQLMLFAGILCSSLTEEDVVKHRCLIMSTSARKSLVPRSWRVPYILDDDETDAWLDYDLLRPRTLFQRIDGFPYEHLECLEEGALDEGLEAQFHDNRPALETLALRTHSVDKRFSHVILFKQLPTAEEQPAFIRWFKKKRAECSKLDRPLNTFWPEEESSQEIRVSLLSR